MNNPLSECPGPDAGLPAGITRHRLTNMTGGWFVGAFAPAAFSTSSVEVAVQRFAAGHCGRAHHHRAATEVTLLLSGRALMGGVLLAAGDILTLAPGVSTAFEALDDCVTVVVKHPGALNDKFYDDEETR